MDTTGLAYRREDQFLRFRRGAEVRWERERRWLLPWGGVAGRGYAPDPRLGGKAREEARVRAREGWDPEVCRGPTFGSGSLGRPWCGRFWSSSPTVLGSFSPFSRRPREGPGEAPGAPGSQVDPQGVRKLRRSQAQGQAEGGPGPRPEVAGHPPLPQGGPPQGEGGLLDGDEEPGGARVGGGVRKDDCGYQGLPASRGPEAEGGKGA